MYVLHDRRNIRLETTHNRTVRWNRDLVWRSLFMLSCLSHTSKEAGLPRYLRVSNERPGRGYAFIPPVSALTFFSRRSAHAATPRLVSSWTSSDACRQKKAGLPSASAKSTPVMSGDIDHFLTGMVNLHSRQISLNTKIAAGENYSQKFAVAPDFSLFPRWNRSKIKT